MEARIGSEGHGLYGVSGLDMQRAVGKRSLEWDLNDWKWDGDLFIARPLNLMPSGGISRQFIPIPVEVQATGNLPNSSSSYSGEANLGAEKEKWELEKKRKVVVIEDDDRNDGEVGSLSLKLGGQGYPIKGKEMANLEGDGGNKSKFVGGNKNRAVCQVEGCGVDLSNAKDYHKRHKVCEMHSKASKAVVGNRMQRFCQQCSRFHVLQEFDEGKRSCRRRLAGHNKRRRKTNPDAIANGTSLNHDQTSGYLLITLLRLLSNMHSNKSDAKVDELLLSDILKSLAGQRDETGERNMHELLQNSQNLLNNGALFGNPEVATLPSKGEGSSRALKEHLSVPKSGMAREVAVEHNSDHMLVHSPPVLKHNVATNSLAYPEVRENAAGPVKMNNFDLNDIYIDSDGGTEDVNRCPAPACDYLDYPLWVRKNSQQSSPPQTSGNSDSASAQSPSSSSGNANSRTDRIIFKLFGKEPKDLPFVLRDQILDWLAHSPTDIESYIRPGCIVLTIFLHQSESAWEELCYNLGSSLSRLFDTLDDTFWRTGWVYIRVQNEIAFVCDGQVIVDTSLSLSSNNYCKILNIKPIAISASERVQFFVKGINLSSPTLRLLCAVEGNYLVQENSDELVDCVDNSERQDEFQCVKFSCTVPNLTGRGFIEIEDPGFSNSFFPFIVAEEDVCSEIRMLEDLLEPTEADTFVELTGKTKAKNEAIDFIHEIGWLLHRSHLKSRLGHLDPNTELFPLRRFKGLIEFSLDREWCAVVKKLLNILLSGIVDTGEHSSANLALSEIGILHRAVRRNSRPLVDFLLRYVPEKLEPETGVLVSGDDESFLFRPDVAGPAGLTPLHIAAGKDDSEDVLDALTNDPGLVGIEAWKSARDSTGSTPEDYARLRGHYSYIHLVQKKINRRLLAGHAVVDIPYSMSLSDNNATQKPSEGAAMSLEIEQKTYRAIQRTDCKLCSNEVHYGKGRRSLLYRPAMLSMVAIAAVCVCVALLFKSCPEVIYVFRPFRWELLDYGTS